MSRIDRELWQWGEDELKEMDWHSLPRMNSVERILRDPGIGSGRGHRILCRERRMKFRHMSALVNRMPDLRKLCVRAWYCFPIGPDGRKRTRRQCADNLMISEKKLKYELERARKFLQSTLGYA